MPLHSSSPRVVSGIGIGLRAPHYAAILAGDPPIDWFEAIAENFMLDGGRPLSVLDRVVERYPVVLHGVGLYPGSAQGLDREHLRRLKSLVRRTGSPWVSEHLCWGSVDGTVTHDLLPLPQTSEVARFVAARLREAQDFLEVPLAVENLSSYVTFRDSTMTEAEFVTEVVERAGCSLLLDVNNVFVSSRNHGFDAFAYLESIPHDRVLQIHVAGHSRRPGVVIDTHDRPVCDEVWELYAHAIHLCGPVPTLLERDDRIPPLEDVIAEARIAGRWMGSAARFAAAPRLEVAVDAR